MPQLISEILDYKKDEKVYGVTFVTTDDYYGMYVAFETVEHLQQSKYENITWFANEWGYSDAELPTKFNKDGYKKEEIVFLVTMGDGDYISEMLLESAKRLNHPKAAEEVISCLK
ncbi:hypothetical protein IGI37_001257 [Enterococcus sp. AZ194]|uniref:hypothetical protein n=1 Tax=Enterococcus sp. AZ194 TaxID=2774629 RepID=UPI003F234FB7